VVHQQPAGSSRTAAIEKYGLPRVLGVNEVTRVGDSQVCRSRRGGADPSDVVYVLVRPAASSSPTRRRARPAASAASNREHCRRWKWGCPHGAPLPSFVRFIWRSFTQSTEGTETPDREGICPGADDGLRNGGCVACSPGPCRIVRGVPLQGDGGAGARWVLGGARRIWRMILAFRREGQRWEGLGIELVLVALRSTASRSGRATHGPSGRESMKRSYVRGRAALLAAGPPCGAGAGWDDGERRASQFDLGVYAVGRTRPTGSRPGRQQQ
jgi:hypothetical protein